MNLSAPLEGRYDLVSRSGTNRVEFGGQTIASGKHVQMEHGSGEADIRFESFSGSIQISD
jgi:hypothetical protein